MSQAGPGKDEVGFRCEACGAFIPFVNDEASGRAETHGHGFVRLTCPACGHHGVYQAAHPEHRPK
jgi:predicted RNA-binding Zn-ribbon protein involved in translation (DUF1610 family)